jgi:hypothetical protein
MINCVSRLGTVVYMVEIHDELEKSSLVKQARQGLVASQTPTALYSPVHFDMRHARSSRSFSTSIYR